MKVGIEVFDADTSLHPVMGEGFKINILLWPAGTRLSIDSNTNIE
jgi:hypothetical protein